MAGILTFGSRRASFGVWSTSRPGWTDTPFCGAPTPRKALNRIRTGTDGSSFPAVNGSAFLHGSVKQGGMDPVPCQSEARKGIPPYPVFPGPSVGTTSTSNLPARSRTGNPSIYSRVLFVELRAATYRAGRIRTAVLGYLRIAPPSSVRKHRLI